MVEEVLVPNFHINIVAAYRKTWTLAMHGIDHEDIRVPPQSQVLGQREDDRVLLERPILDIWRRERWLYVCSSWWSRVPSSQEKLILSS
jgi:hypothetical protein